MGQPSFLLGIERKDYYKGNKKTKAYHQYFLLLLIPPAISFHLLSSAFVLFSTI